MLGRLPLLMVAVLLLGAVAVSRQMPAPPLAPDGDNQEIQGQIQSALRAQSSLGSSSLEVKVTDSQIELAGSVPTAREKETARRVAQSYGNNRTVEDKNIIVRNAAAARGTEAPQR